jgi:hypothetical protein
MKTYNLLRAEDYNALGRKQIDDDAERKPDICKCEPGED